MSAQYPDIDQPPLEPIDEVIEEDHSDFSAQCLALVDSFILKSSLVFQRRLVTRNAQWGLIWRGDYRTADEAAPTLVNRIMCWKGLDGKIVMAIAIGQRIAPLPVTNSSRPDGREI